MGYVGAIPIPGHHTGIAKLILAYKFLPTAYFANNIPSWIVKMSFNCTKFKRPSLFCWKLFNTDI
jgi:hypothetical protein